MWKRTVPLLVLLSVTLNLGFVGVWVAQAFCGAWLKHKQPHQYEQEVWCPLHRDLGVTEQQWECLEPLLIQFRHEAGAISRQMNSKRSDLIDLVAAENPDSQAIADKQKEIRLVQQQMQQLVIDLLLTEKRTLTADQQAKLFAIMREPSSCHRPSRMLRLGETDTDCKDDAMSR